MSRETDNQERQTVRALLPTVSPDTDKLLRRLDRNVLWFGLAAAVVGNVVIWRLAQIASLLERLIEAQAP